MIKLFYGKLMHERDKVCRSWHWRIVISFICLAKFAHRKLAIRGERGARYLKKFSSNPRCRAPAKKDRHVGSRCDAAACSEDQRARRSRLCPRARAMIIIMRCPAPAIFEGRPAPLLPYCEARRSERAVRARGGRRRGEREEECTCINFAPQHAAHTRLLAVHTLYAHYVGTTISEIPDPVRVRCSFWALSHLLQRSRCSFFSPLALCNANLAQ